MHGLEEDRRVSAAPPARKRQASPRFQRDLPAGTRSGDMKKLCFSGGQGLPTTPNLDSATSGTIETTTSSGGLKRGILSDDPSPEDTITVDSPSWNIPFRTAETSLACGSYKPIKQWQPDLAAMCGLGKDDIHIPLVNTPRSREAPDI